MSSFPSFPSLPALTYKPRKEYRTPLPEDESDHVLKKLTGYGSSALQTGLKILDTPGSIVRGGLGHLVGARPQEGERTSGRDLTDAIGLTSKHSNSWLSSGVGLGADILTDPLTYLTAGTHHALTPAGKALSKIGYTKTLGRKAMLEGVHGLESSHIADSLRLGKTLPEAESLLAHSRNQGARIATPEMESAVLKATGQPLQANTPLGALGGIGLPFGSPSLLFGQGRHARTIAGGLDAVGDKLRYGTPIGRWAGGLFNHHAGESVGGATQKAHVRYGSPSSEATNAATRDHLALLRSAVDRHVKAGLHEDDILRAARQHAEGATIRPVGTDPLLPFSVNPALQAAAHEVGGILRKSSDLQMAEAKRLGLPLADVNDPFIQYVPRHGIDDEAAKKLIAGQAAGPTGLQPQVVARNNFPVTSGSNIHRDEPYRGIPGGTEMINDLAVKHAADPLGIGLAGIQKDIKKALWLEAKHSGIATNPALGLQLDAKAAELAPVLLAKDAFHSDPKNKGIGIFSSNLDRDVARRGEQQARTVRSATTAHGFIGDNARKLQPGDEPISKTLKALGLTTRIADQAAGTPIEGALVQALQALAKQGAPMADPFLHGKIGKLRKQVDQFGLPRELHDELIASHGKWSMPEVLREPSGFFGGLTSAFKNLAYPIWPASHVRNAASAGLNNLLDGTGIGDHVAQFKLMRGTLTADEARRLIPDLPPGISDEAARDLLRRDQFAHGKVFSGHSGQFDLDNSVTSKLAGAAPGRVIPAPVGSDRAPTGSFIKDTGGLIGGGAKDEAIDLGRYVKNNPFQSPLTPGGGFQSPIKNPFEMGGVFGGVEDFPALQTGRAVGSNVEDFFRGANWFGGRRGGLDSATAGRRARDTHFDYDELTNFEKKVMRKVVPFYCVPEDHEILTKRGWKTWDQLAIGDPVMSYNHQTGEMSWEPLEAVATFHYVGELLMFKRTVGKKDSKPTRFLFTEDHRWPVETIKTFTKGKWYGGARSIVRARDLNTTHKIPLTGEFRDDRESSLSPRHAAILGWVVTDGYHRWRGSHCEMLVYQSPKKHLAEIIALLGTQPRDPHPASGVVPVPVAIEDVRVLTEVFRSKADLSKVVGTLSRESAEAMYDAMFKAEGSTSESGQENFAQEIDLNRETLDAFQMLVYMTGRAGNKATKGLNIRRQDFLCVKEGIKKTFYSGTIWCPQTKHGTWVMRHDGAVIITGNTFARKNLPLQVGRLAHAPAATVTHLRALSAGRDPSTYLPDYLAGGAAIPTGPEEDGKRQFVSKLGTPLEEALERFKFKGGLPDIPATALAFGANLNPLLKAPIEQIFNTQMHTGRKLSDLHAPAAASALGRLWGDDNPQLFSQILVNTPATRFVTTLDKIIDNRKGLAAKLANLTTGVSVTDVDLQKARAAEAAQARGELLSQMPHVKGYTNYYVRPGEEVNLTPQEVELLRAQATGQRDARAARKAEAMRIGFAPR